MSRPSGEEVAFLLRHIAALGCIIAAANDTDDRKAMVWLFAATYFLIHAHGSRIFDAVKAQGRKP